MSTQSLARALFLLALSVALSILVTAIQVSKAHAQDMSAELEQFNAECFDSAGEFEPTDGCYEYAESIGIEIDNLNESMDKGCVLSDLYEDYSCKGPQGPSSPSSFSSSASEQDESADTGCVTVDMTDPEVSGQDIDILTKSYGFDAKADNDELMYSPECFEQGIVQWDWDAMVNNPCYDVLSDASGESYWVEYIGCPEVPVTQEGTYAPLNWRDHVVPVKPASSQKAVSGQSKVSSTREARTSSLSTTNPYVVHRDSNNGRSQGLVVSESKRAESHAAATKVQAKLAAAEKAKKAANKRR